MVREGNRNAFKHGSRKNPEYKSWESMLGRCYYEADHSYRWYGACGIQVCDRWRGDFKAFLADLGPKPSNRHTLDRIDRAGNYEPSNCRWADPFMQARTRGNTKLNAAKVIQMRELWASGEWRQKDLAALFGVAQPTVSEIVNGKKWVEGSL